MLPVDTKDAQNFGGPYGIRTHALSADNRARSLTAPTVRIGDLDSNQDLVVQSHPRYPCTISERLHLGWQERIRPPSPE